MAVDLHNNSYHSQLLLPSPQSQFFHQDHDDDTLNLPNKPIASSTTINCWSRFGSSDSGSVLSSPVESELGSTETESDTDDDYIAELTHRMAHYMFQDDDKHERSWGLAGSPQPTLWSTLGSSHENPIGPSREPSPPLSIMIEEELEKMKINKLTLSNNSGVANSYSNPNVEFHSRQALIGDQIRAIQFQRLKQEQAMKQLDQKKQFKHYQDKGRAYGGFKNGQRTIRPATSSSSPWSALQQQQTNQQRPSSGMRAVFLGESNSRTGSCGTGVFLPKGTGYSSESRKKPGCSTVLIPARVVQALKQHFDKVGVPSRFTRSFPAQHDAVMGGRNSLYSQQQHLSGRGPVMNHQEISLPQEWTY